MLSSPRQVKNQSTASRSALKSAQSSDMSVASMEPTKSHSHSQVTSAAEVDIVLNRVNADKDSGHPAPDKGLKSDPPTPTIMSTSEPPPHPVTSVLQESRQKNYNTQTSYSSSRAGEEAHAPVRGHAQDNRVTDNSSSPRHTPPNLDTVKKQQMTTTTTTTATNNMDNRHLSTFADFRAGNILDFSPAHEVNSHQNVHNYHHHNQHHHHHQQQQQQQQQVHQNHLQNHHIGSSSSSSKISKGKKRAEEEATTREDQHEDGRREDDGGTEGMDWAVTESRFLKSRNDKSHSKVKNSYLDNAASSHNDNNQTDKHNGGGSSSSKAAGTYTVSVDAHAISGGTTGSNNNNSTTNHRSGASSSKQSQVERRKVS